MAAALATMISIDTARERMANAIFKDWSKDELDAFVKSMRKFADALDAEPPIGGVKPG